MNSKQNYIALIMELTDVSYREAEKIVKELLKQQKLNRDDILNKLGQVLLVYNIVDDKIILSPSKKKNIYNEFCKILDRAFRNEILIEEDNIKSILIQSAKDKIHINDYVTQSMFKVNYELLPVSEEVLDKIINTKIDKKLWSDRIWKNKNDVAKVIKKEIKKFLVGETSINDIYSTVKKKYNVNATNTARLVRTEIARVQSQANEVWAYEHNIEYQMFMATLDMKTSKMCQAEDGKVYNYNDTGKPIPPLHPNCRSELVNMPNEDWRPKYRMDNITKEKISYKNYQEWRKEQNLD